MPELKQKKWMRLFLAVSCMVLLQVGWWTSVFMRDVQTLADSKVEALNLRMASGETLPSTVLKEVENGSFHRRVMFLSESIFFALLTLFGLYLLYRALKAEERSRVTQRNFIEIVTHESKTPMTALKLRLESLLEKAGENSKRDLGLALDEVRRLVSIFERAMSLNRAEREALRFEPLAFSEVIEQVVRRLEPFFKSRGVLLTLELDPDLWVSGDWHGLENSLQSLLENAVLYNDKTEKTLRVSLRADYMVVRLSIVDNGPGIAAADRAQLFDRFYRGQSSRSIPGTGLGLYIAKTIIEAHQGSLRLVEETESGTHFEVQLPRHAGENE